MKKLLVSIAILLRACGLVYGDDIADPQAHYLTNYQAGDFVNKLMIDVNGDGRTDVLFTYAEANPDPTTRISEAQEGGSLSWDAFIAKDTGAFTFSVGVEEAGNSEVTQGAGPSLNPNQMYVGNISEIGRYGIISTGVKRYKSQENATIIYAYYWKDNHFKELKLVEFPNGGPNPLFDKYLTEEKRTHVTLQQIKP